MIRPSLLPHYRSLLFVLLLLLCGLRLTWNLSSTVEVPATTDDFTYLIKGPTVLAHLNGHQLEPIPHTEFRGESYDPNFGPGYSLWLMTCSKFVRDPLLMFCFSAAFLSILNTLLLFALMRSNNMSDVFAFLVAYCYLLSPLSLPVVPKVTSYCVTILLITLLVLVRCKAMYPKYLIALAGTACMMFVRPEFKLSLALIAMMTLREAWSLMSQREWTTRKSIALLSVSGWIMILCYIFGNIFSDDSGRFQVAYGQHFAYNYAHWNRLDIDPFVAYQSIVQQVFGQTSGFLDMLYHHPGPILHHFTTNLVHYLGAVIQYLLGVFLPTVWFPIGPWGVLSIYLVAVSGWLYFKKISLRLSQVNQPFTKHSTSLTIGLAWLLPSIITCLIFAPRAHYLALQLVLVIFLASLFLGGVKQKQLGANTSFLLALVAIFLVPLPATNKNLSTSRPIALSMEYLRQRSDLQHARFFQTELLQVKTYNTAAELLPFPEPGVSLTNFILDYEITLVCTDTKGFSLGIPYNLENDLSRIGFRKIVFYNSCWWFRENEPIADDAKN